MLKNVTESSHPSAPGPRALAWFADSYGAGILLNLPLLGGNCAQRPRRRITSTICTERASPPRSGGRTPGPGTGSARAYDKIFDTTLEGPGEQIAGHHGLKQDP